MKRVLAFFLFLFVGYVTGFIFKQIYITSPECVQQAAERCDINNYNPTECRDHICVVCEEHC